MSLYHDLIIDHYKNPRNFGTLDKPDLVAQEANASCGDLIEFQIEMSHIARRTSHVAQIKWRGVGCAISTAAASLLSERIKSQEPRAKNILEMTDEDMVKMLGGDISPTRLKCATLSLKAIQKSFKQLNAKI
jgi:nitrogen fixation NifU-like protein